MQHNPDRTGNAALAALLGAGLASVLLVGGDRAGTAPGSSADAAVPAQGIERADAGRDAESSWLRGRHQRGPREIRNADGGSSQVSISQPPAPASLRQLVETYPDLVDVLGAEVDYAGGLTTLRLKTDGGYERVATMTEDLPSGVESDGSGDVPCPGGEECPP